MLAASEIIVPVIPNRPKSLRKIWGSLWAQYRLTRFPVESLRQVRRPKLWKQLPHEMNVLRLSTKPFMPYTIIHTLSLASCIYPEKTRRWCQQFLCWAKIRFERSAKKMVEHILLQLTNAFPLIRLASHFIYPHFQASWCVLFKLNSLFLTGCLWCLVWLCLSIPFIDLYKISAQAPELLYAFLKSINLYNFSC